MRICWANEIVTEIAIGQKATDLGGNFNAPKAEKFCQMQKFTLKKTPKKRMKIHSLAIFLDLESLW